MSLQKVQLSDQINSQKEPTPTWVIVALGVAFVFGALLTAFGGASLGNAQFLSQSTRAIGTIGLSVLTGVGALGMIAILGGFLKVYVTNRAQKSKNEQLLSEAIEKDDLDAFKPYYQHKFKNNFTLHIACKNSSWKIAEYLIDTHPGLLKALDNDGNLPIFYTENHMPLFRKMLDKELDKGKGLLLAKNRLGTSAVEILIEKGTTDDYFKYASENHYQFDIALVVKHSKTEIFNAMLVKKASLIDSKYPGGRNILMQIIPHDDSNWTFTRILVGKKRELTSEADSQGVNAFGIALRFGKTFPLEFLEPARRH